MFIEAKNVQTTAIPRGAPVAMAYPGTGVDESGQTFGYSVVRADDTNATLTIGAAIDVIAPGQYGELVIAWGAFEFCLFQGAAAIDRGQTVHPVAGGTWDFVAGHNQDDRPVYMPCINLTDLTLGEVVAGVEAPGFLRCL